MKLQGRRATQRAALVAHDLIEGVRIEASRTAASAPEHALGFAGGQPEGPAHGVVHQRSVGVAAAGLLEQPPEETLQLGVVRQR